MTDAGDERSLRRMRRFFVAGAALLLLALGATGCGRSDGETSNTRSNRARAHADARNLLAMVRVPAGSTLAVAPHNTGFDQVQDFIGVLASATASRTWIVKDSADETLRYAVAHLHRGSKLDSTGSGDGVSQIRSWPPIKGVLDGRWLELQAYSYGNRTYLTARAQSQWVITRNASERLPSSVTKVTIRVTGANGNKAHQFTITRHRTVAQVVRLYNSLGVIQPATILGCPPQPAGVLALRFYDSPSHVIATANSPTGADVPWPASAAAWACFPIKLTLAQHRAPSLSGNVISPLAKLLHTRLIP